MSQEFEYVKSAQRYRWKDSKRFVSFSLVEKLRQTHIDQGSDRVANITEQMISGEITLDEWDRAMMAEVKDMYVQQYQLGHPGPMTAKDRGTVGSKIRFVYNRLYSFRTDIADGKLSEAQIRYRAQLYSNNGRWGYEKGHTQSHIDAGFIWERRIKPATDSCVECIAYMNAGWQPIGFLPEATESCSCMANCKCYKEFSAEVIKPENNAFVNPWQPLLLQLLLQEIVFFL